MPTPGRRRVKRAAAVIDREVGRVVAAHREDGERPRPAQPASRRGRTRPATRLSEEEIRDETVTLYIGGHETTSSTLVWAWYLLAREPRVRAALAGELDRVLGDREPGFDDFARPAVRPGGRPGDTAPLPDPWLLTGIAKEGASARRAARRTGHPGVDQPVGGPPRPRAGSATPRCSGRSGGLEGADESVPEYAWFPFGGGPRVCVGARFATVEAVLILAVLGRRYALDVDPGEIRPMTTLTLQPDRAMLATVRVRGDAA